MKANSARTKNEQIHSSSLRELRRFLTDTQASSMDVDSARVAAAVIVVIATNELEQRIVLTRRSQEVEHHKGEICFPGGVKDSQDTNLLETALREAHEELGISATDVEILGALGTVCPMTTPFIIHPYVGLIPYPYVFEPNPSEVAEVLQVPLSHLQDPTNYREEARLQDGQILRERYYEYKGHLIFGATARILAQALKSIQGSF